MKKSRKILIPVILAAIVSSCSKTNKSIILPDFEGASVEEISAWAEKNDIDTQYTYFETCDYEEGICLSTSPENLTELEPGSTVTFVITVHPDKIDISDHIPVTADPTIKPDDSKAPEPEKFDGDPNQDSRPVEEPVGN